MFPPAITSESLQGAIFMVNRSLTEPVLTNLFWEDGKAVQVDQAWQLAGSAPKMVNSWEEPNLICRSITHATVPAGVPLTAHQREIAFASPLLRSAFRMLDERDHP